MLYRCSGASVKQDRKVYRGVSAPHRHPARHARPRRADIGAGHAAWRPVPSRARPARTAGPRRPPHQPARRTERRTERRADRERTAARSDHRPNRYAAPTGSFGLRRPLRPCSSGTLECGSNTSAAPLPMRGPGGSVLRVGLPPDDMVTISESDLPRRHQLSLACRSRSNASLTRRPRFPSSYAIR